MSGLLTLSRSFLPVILIAIVLGYYSIWLYMGHKQAKENRNETLPVSDEEFLKHILFKDNALPEHVALAFKYFFESAYSLDNLHLISPNMTIEDLSSISPASPMVDDLEVCFLLKRLEDIDQRHVQTLQNGTIAEIIVMCWKLGIHVRGSRLL